MLILKIALQLESHFSIIFIFLNFQSQNLSEVKSKQCLNGQELQKQANSGVSNIGSACIKNLCLRQQGERGKSWPGVGGGKGRVPPS